MESSEIGQTLAELQKTADDAIIYKAAGSLLIKANKADVIKDLNERKRTSKYKNHCYGTPRRTHAQSTQRAPSQTATRSQPSFIHSL